MINKLSYDQVSNFWPAIKQAALESREVPEGTVLAYTNELLINLLSGQAQAWLGQFGKTVEEIPTCIVLTSIKKDTVFNFKYLSIDAVLGLGKFSTEEVDETLEVMRLFALSLGCKFVRAQVMFEDMKSLFDLTKFKKSPISIYELTV